jgi:hypothetical protein
MAQVDNDRRLVALAQALRAFRDEWPHQLELIALKAKIAKARYDAAKAEGFDTRDALVLCVRDIEV